MRSGFTVCAGLSGIGFVVLAIVINAVYIRGRLPMPVAGNGFEAVAANYAEVGTALRRPSVAAPAGWLFLTIFAAGLLAVSWHGGSGPQAWALVGFAGVLMQNVTFACVEALRFGLATAAAQHRESMPALWTLSNVLFGFNQLFLATALLGFTATGVLTSPWQTTVGYLSAALLFLSSSAAPYNATATSRLAFLGGIGWLGWATWIIANSIALVRL
ncbi:hypothetical protein ACIP5Y_41505 [Nocardia sp. NPDC088792]|uniref:hypothetical protein n=1 Tax=Nocardia sp. NPDC088792 TaxID=3364332 RepID=UPI003817B47F